MSRKNSSKQTTRKTPPGKAWKTLPKLARLAWNWGIKALSSLAALSFTSQLMLAGVGLVAVIWLSRVGAYDKKYAANIQQGEAALCTGQYSKAKQDFQAALKRNPVQWIAAKFLDEASARQVLDDLGWAQEALLGWQKAEAMEASGQDLEQVLKHLDQEHPGDPDLQTLLGKFYLARGGQADFTKAEAYFTAALAAKPCAEAAHGLGLIRQWQGDFKQAEALFLKAQQQAEASPVYEIDLAWLYVEQERYGEAVALYNKHAQTEAIAAFELGLAYRLSGNIKSAMEAFQRAWQLLKDKNDAEFNPPYWQYRVNESVVSLSLVGDQRCYVRETLALTEYLEKQPAPGQASKPNCQNPLAIQALLAFEAGRLARARPEWAEKIAAHPQPAPPAR